MSIETLLNITLDCGFNFSNYKVIKIYLFEIDIGIIDVEKTKRKEQKVRSIAIEAEYSEICGMK